MSLPRFFLSEQVLEREHDRVFELALDVDDIKHARALRLRSGEHIEVIDGDSNYYELCIERFDSDGILASIASRESSCATLPRIALFQGLPKLDKLDAVIRGATEVGVAEVHPVLCERSISRPDPKKARGKHERWQAIAKSAAMQSGASAIPVVHEIESLSNAATDHADATLVFWEEAIEQESPTISEALADAMEAAGRGGTAPQDIRVSIWIGPEGGLGEDEVAAILGSAERPHVLSLGPTILRTETAGIIAPALVAHEMRQLLRGSQKPSYGSQGQAHETGDAS